MPSLDEQIAQGLQRCLDSGELASAPSWGKPLPLDDGWDETPPELRLAFKVIKDAGFVPHEVVLMRRVAELKRQLAAAGDLPQAEPLRRQMADAQQLLSLRLERLRASRSL
jgi:Domain of unknown function (DUF1992)